MDIQCYSYATLMDDRSRSRRSNQYSTVSLPCLCDITESSASTKNYIDQDIHITDSLRVHTKKCKINFGFRINSIIGPTFYFVLGFGMLFKNAITGTRRYH